MTSISLCDPCITNHTYLVKYQMQNMVQEILSLDWRHFAEDKISIFTKGCCLTGNNRVWNREACSFTWPEKTHTDNMTSPHIYLETVGSTLKGGWWSHYWWFILYGLFNLFFLIWTRTSLQFSSYPQTQITVHAITPATIPNAYFSVFLFFFTVWWTWMILHEGGYTWATSRYMTPRVTWCCWVSSFVRSTSWPKSWKSWPIVCSIHSEPWRTRRRRLTGRNIFLDFLLIVNLAMYDL